MPPTAREGLPPGPKRPFRNLADLKASGASWRTLNLLSVWERAGDTEDYKLEPLFRHTALNRAIILKHRLRRQDEDLFFDGRRVGTKIVLPINICDLRAGGRSFLIGQRGYEGILEELGLKSESHGEDRELLEVMDALPSLDPFLLRERLRQEGRAPARCYFEITEADSAKMFEFTRREITPLIGMSFGSLSGGVSDKVSKLAAKLLNNAGDAELEPLRVVMALDKTAFEEGVFSWKGFIYYNWSLLTLAPQIRPVSNAIAAVKPERPYTSEERSYILEARARIALTLASACNEIRQTIKIYDDAYAELTLAGQPRAFRDFLVQAPQLFKEVGERMGSVEHIISFWRFRAPATGAGRLAACELADLLRDFEQSLERSGAREAPIETSTALAVA